MLERICWIVLALIHVTPFALLFSPASIGRLYSVASDSGNLPLLQHRAVLFGCIMLVCLWAAFDPHVRQLAAIVVALSMISFLAIYLLSDRPISLRSIAIVDATGVPFLAYAAWRAFGT